MKIARSSTTAAFPTKRIPLPLPKKKVLFSSREFDRLSEQNKAIIKIADAGNDESCYRLAINLIEGKNGFRVNADAGVQYLERAISNDHIEAINYYGRILTEGIYVDENNEKAIEIYTKGAEKKSAESMIRLALLKESRNPDDPDIMSLIKESAQLGNAEAMYYYGRQLKKDNDKTNAALYYKMSCDKGFPRGINAYGVVLEEGWAGEPDEEEAAKFYKMAADKNCSAGMRNYGYMLEDGRGGLKKDLKMATKFYRKAASLGDVDGMVCYAYMLETGRGIKKDEKHAKKLYMRAASKKSPEAMNSIGQMYRDGRGVDQNIIKALHYFKASSDLGSEQGTENFQYLYEDAHPKEEVLQRKKPIYEEEEDASDSDSSSDDDESDEDGNDENDEGDDTNKKDENNLAKYEDLKINDPPTLNDVYTIKLYANSGNVSALIKYGDFLSKGDVCRQDLPEAFKCYKYAALHHKDPEGYMKLAKCFLDGLGVEKDLRKAAKYYKRAGELGITEACVIYGRLCERNDEGLEENPLDSVTFYKKAIEKDNVEAMICYSNLFKRGFGVKKNNKKAAQYMRMAYEKGDMEAAAQFGKMIALGKGVERNPDEAKKVLKKSSDSGNENGKKFYQLLLSNQLFDDEDDTSATDQNSRKRRRTK